MDPFKTLSSCQLGQRSGDFPDGAEVKNLPAHAGDMGLIPGLGRFHTPRGN